MLCFQFGIGFLITPPLLLVLSLVVFMIGTEIRVRIEDALLASRFGEQFEGIQTQRSHLHTIREIALASQPQLVLLRISARNSSRVCLLWRKAPSMALVTA
jgi:hypothetical protein